MTDTTCPSCDAPAPARARSCARCGYRFLEDAAPARRTRPGARTVGLVAAALLAAVALTAAVLAIAGGDAGDEAAAGDLASPALDVLSPHPLGARTLERLLEERFTPMRDDDTASVRCSGRIAKRAHSVRRCVVRYPLGAKRSVVVLTTANGAEVLSQP